MTEERSPTGGGSDLDVERLAAFLDGTLEPDEHAKVIRLLAESDDALEVVAEAMRLREEEEDLPVSDGATGTRRFVGWSRWRWVPLAAAAAAGGLLLVPTLMRAPSVADAVFEVAEPGTLPDAWNRHGWEVTRGPVEPASLGGGGSFRAGVLWADALFAWQAGQVEEAVDTMERLSVVVRAVPLAEPVLQELDGVRQVIAAGTRREEAGARVIRTERTLAELLPADLVRFGGMAEAARLAAVQGQVPPLRGLEGLAGSAELRAYSELAVLVDRLLEAARMNVDPSALAELLTALVEAGGRIR